MTPITVDTELVEPDYHRLRLWASVRNVFLVIIYSTNLVALFAIMPGISSGRASALAAPPLAFQAFILVGLPSILYLSTKSMFRKMSLEQRSIRYRFTNESIETVTGYGSSNVSWTAIQRVAETSSAFYVSSQKNLYQIVPKRSFQAAAEIERFRELVRSKLGKKARVKKAASNNPRG